MKSVGIGLIWRLLALLVCWQLALVVLPALKPTFAESNLVSNQIRIQNLESKEEGACVILGSSMVARLNPDVVSEQAGLPVVQLGLDGGSGKIGVEILKQSGYEPALLVVEMNGLLLEGGVNEESLLGQLGEPVFKLAKVIPSVRAESRPSAVVYSQLKRDLGQDDLSVLEKKWIDEFQESLRTLKISGRRIILLLLPNGERANDREYLVTNALAESLGAQVLDLKAQAEEGEYFYTDGLHLDLPSGERASLLLGKSLKELK